MTCEACGSHDHELDLEAPRVSCCQALARSTNGLTAAIWRARAGSAQLRARLLREAGYAAEEARVAEAVRAALASWAKAAGHPASPRAVALDHPENLATARRFIADKRDPAGITQDEARRMLRM